MFYFPFFESSFYTVNNDIYIYIYVMHLSQVTCKNKDLQ